MGAPNSAAMEEPRRAGQSCSEGRACCFLEMVEDFSRHMASIRRTNKQAACDPGILRQSQHAWRQRPEPNWEHEAKREMQEAFPKMEGGPPTGTWVCGLFWLEATLSTSYLRASSLFLQGREKEGRHSRKWGCLPSPLSAFGRKLHFLAVSGWFPSKVFMNLAAKVFTF